MYHTENDSEIRLIYSAQHKINNIVGRLNNTTDPAIKTGTSVVLRDNTGNTATYISKFNSTDLSTTNLSSTNLSTTNLSAYNNDNNEITLKSSIILGADNTIFIGSSTKKLSNIYSTNANINTATISNLNSYSGGNINLNSNFVLGADNTYSIGSGPTNRVKNIYSYNVVSNIATIAGTNINSLSATVLGSSKNLTRFTNQLYFDQGAVFGGSAAQAGLVTRGICGINNSGTTFTKDNLYINYEGDNDNTYKSNRQLILQAGADGGLINNNHDAQIYNYAAVRGDQLKKYVEGHIGALNTSLNDSISGVSSNLSKHAAIVASASALGHIQIGFATNADNRNYAVQLSGNKAYVNIPWKEPSGSGFSTSGNAFSLNFSDDNIINVTDSDGTKRFSHKTYTAQTIAASWSSAANQQHRLLIPNVTSDSYGHISAGGTTPMDLSTNYLRCNADDTFEGNLTVTKTISLNNTSSSSNGIYLYAYDKSSNKNDYIRLYSDYAGNKSLTYEVSGTFRSRYKLSFQPTGYNFNYRCPNKSGTLAVIENYFGDNGISLTESENGDTITLKIGNHTLTFKQAAENNPLEITFK